MALRLRSRFRRITHSRIVIWSLALAVGWATASVVARARDEGRSWGQRRAVIVAARTVRAGTPVRRADVLIRSVPITVVPTGALASGDTDALVGRVLRSPIFAGQILVREQVAGPRLSAARVLVGRGRRGLAIATGDARPPVRVGDHVDVVAVRGVGDGPGPDGVVASDAEVVEVGDRSVTVAVDAGDAVELAQAMASGPLLLALRGG